MTTKQQTRIGFAGLGIMGAGMARNFLREGYPLTVWNRSRARAQPLEDEGAQVAETPAALAAASDVVFTCLSNPAVVEEVALGPEGLLAGARSGLRWVETSTIGAAASVKMRDAAEGKGVRYLEAPVTGSKIGARDGSLVVMTGGPRDLHEECEPVIGAFASKVIYVGPIPQGSVMKLIGNSIISFMLEGIAEGMVLGDRAGIPGEKILEVIQASGFASPYWDVKGGAMASRDFETHFALELLHKDQALALDEGKARAVPLPGLAAIHLVTGHACKLGYGGEDIAAQVKAVEEGALAQDEESE